MPGKRLWLWCFLIVAGAAVLWIRSEYMEEAEPTGNLETRVVFVTGGSDDFWKLTVRGAEAAAQQHNADLKIEMLDQDEGLSQQMEILVNLKGEEVDGCAISPLDAEGQTLVINRLADRMKVVTFDSDAPLSQRHYYIGTSNYRAGQICKELVEEALPDGGKVVVFLSNLTKNNMKERKAGYDETGDLEKWETLEYFADEGVESKARENIQEALEEHEDLGCIVGMNGYHGPLLREVLAETGHLGKLKLVVFDWAPETLAGIEQGEIHGTVAQDPYHYGFDAVRMLTSLHNGTARDLPLVGGGQIMVPCEAVRKDSLVAFQDKLKQRMNDKPTE